MLSRVSKGCRKAPRTLSTRRFHNSPRILRELFDPSNVERVQDEVDVCIVGGGPAGISAAIRLKQLEQEKGKEVRVVVLEKGGEIGECLIMFASPASFTVQLHACNDSHTVCQPAL